jgi:molybdenum cofactor biosynthesis protein MoaC
VARSWEAFESVTTSQPVDPVLAPGGRLCSVIYGFDEVDERLELLPMAARRALDHAGLRLSREGWGSLSFESRRRLIEAGAERAVDSDLVRQECSRATPAPEAVEPSVDPDGGSVPADISKTLGPDRPLPAATWSALTALDRFALAKAVARGRPERVAAVYDEIVGQTAVSTHLDARGAARMVDVGEKPATLRRAVSRSEVRMSEAAFARLARIDADKGDVIAAARIAGIMGAKRTSDLIPLCHPIALSKVTVDFELDAESSAVRIVATAEAVDRTGVEMESLVAASVAGLTIYDMLKSIDRGMVIGPTTLVEKSGGRSGHYKR